MRGHMRSKAIVEQWSTHRLLCTCIVHLFGYYIATSIESVWSIQLLRRPRRRQLQLLITYVNCRLCLYGHRRCREWKWSRVYCCVAQSSETIRINLHLHWNGVGHHTTTYSSRTALNFNTFCSAYFSTRFSLLLFCCDSRQWQRE